MLFDTSKKEMLNPNQGYKKVVQKLKQRYDVSYFLSSAHILINFATFDSAKSTKVSSNKKLYNNATLYFSVDLDSLSLHKNFKISVPILNKVVAYL